MLSYNLKFPLFESNSSVRYLISLRNGAAAAQDAIFKLGIADVVLITNNIDVDED